MNILAPGCDSNALLDSIRTSPYSGVPNTKDQAFSPGRVHRDQFGKHSHIHQCGLKELHYPLPEAPLTEAKRMLFLVTRHREFMKKDQRIVQVVYRLTRSSLPKLTVYRPVGSPVIVPYIGVDMDSTLPAEFNLLCRPMPVQFANNFKEL